MITNRGADADAELAADLATRAGELLLRLRSRMGFTDPDALRDAGDQHSHEFLVAELAKARPDDAVLSEEGADDRSRLHADRLWIVDPLDGTNEYGDEGRTDWAVHVALWQRSDGEGSDGGGSDGGGSDGGASDGGRGVLTAAAVALPARRMTLSTDGHYPPLPAVADPPRLAVSRSRAPAFVADLAADIGIVPTPIGSAGMKAMSILLGESDAYVHRGRMKEWDSAAPAAVAAAAGLHVSGLDGSPLQFNTPERLTLDLLICQPSLAAPILDSCRRRGLAH